MGKSAAAAKLQITLADILADYLHQAVEEEDASTVQFLLRQGATAEESLLPLAVEKQDEEKVKTLLTLASDSFSTEIRQTSLIKAMHLDKAELVSCLLDVGAVDPNFVIDEDTQETPLHLAVTEYQDLVELLLEQGANPNTRDADGQTPLHCVGPHYLAARCMILHGADPEFQDKDGDTTLHVACFHGHLETAKELHGTDPHALNDDGDTALHHACRGGHLPVIQWLIREADANPNLTSKNSLFGYAFHSGKLMPKALIELGLDPWQVLIEEGGTVAHAALSAEIESDDDENYRLRFLDELLECVPALVHSVDHAQQTLLHLAARLSPRMVRLLVAKHGANLMAKDKYGRIPLVETMFVDCDAAMVECLLVFMKERRLNVDEADQYGWTALHWATFHGHDCVELLLKYGANPNQVNHKGRRPLHLVGYPFFLSRYMNSFTDRDISRILDTKRAPFSSKDEEDACRTSKATTNGGLEDLLSRGANATLPDQDGNLPFFLAAAAFRVSDTFLMIRGAATQGLFGTPCRDYKLSKGKRKVHHDHFQEQGKRSRVNHVRVHD